LSHKEGTSQSLHLGTIFLPPLGFYLFVSPFFPLCPFLFFSLSLEDEEFFLARCDVFLFFFTVIASLSF